METNNWLNESIIEFIKNNNGCNSVDIVNHFKLKADIIFKSIDNLVKKNKIKRKHTHGYNCEYIVK